MAKLKPQQVAAEEPEAPAPSPATTYQEPPPAPAIKRQALSKAPLPEPLPPEPAVIPEPAQAVRSALYRVWPHGTLQRDGKTYQPGETLTLDPEVAKGIPCLERA